MEHLAMSIPKCIPKVHSAKGTASGLPKGRKKYSEAARKKPQTPSEEGETRFTLGIEGGVGARLVPRMEGHSGRSDVTKMR